MEEPTGDDVFALNGVATLTRGDGTPIRLGGWMPSPRWCPTPGIFDYVASGDPPPVTGDEVFLWEALYRVCGDKYPPFNWQLTGSCVHGGYKNALKLLMAQEIVSRPEPEAWAEPFCLHVYGLSRYLGWGETREGEGSFGLSMARAGDEGGGFVPEDDPDVVKSHVCGPAECVDAPVELRWSSVRNCPAGVKERSKKYRVQYVRCRTKEQALDHLRRRHPLTFAGDWGGQDRGVVRGTTHPVLTMPRRETWNHQQGVWGWWNHPELGALWYVQNQWWNPGTTKYTTRNRGIWQITQPGIARPMHGDHPAITAPGWSRPPFPPGGYWVTDDDVTYQCETGEVCAMILVDGVTGREVGVGNI